MQEPQEKKKYNLLSDEDRNKVLKLKQLKWKNKQISIQLGINLKTVASVKQPTRQSEYGPIKMALLNMLIQIDPSTLMTKKIVLKKIREVIENPDGEVKMAIHLYNAEKNTEKKSEADKNRILEFTKKNRKIVEQVAEKYLRLKRGPDYQSDGMIEESTQDHSSISQLDTENQITGFPNADQQSYMLQDDLTEMQEQLRSVSLDDHSQETFTPIDDFFLKDQMVLVQDIEGNVIEIKNGSRELLMGGSLGSFMSGLEEPFTQ